MVFVRVLCLAAVLGALTLGGVSTPTQTTDWYQNSDGADSTVGLPDGRAEDPKDIWSDCGKPSDVGHINSVSIVPDPPLPGKSLNITVSASLDKTVTSGTVTVTVVYEKYFPYTKKYPLCTLVADIGRQCPLPQGNFSVSVDTTVTNVPKGHYTGKALATDQSGDTVFCVGLDFVMP